MGELKLTQEEQARLKVLNHVLEHTMSAKEAAIVLGTERTSCVTNFGGLPEGGSRFACPRKPCTKRPSDPYAGSPTVPRCPAGDTSRYRFQERFHHLRHRRLGARRSKCYSRHRCATYCFPRLLFPAACKTGPSTPRANSPPDESLGCNTCGKGTGVIHACNSQGPWYQ